MKQILSVLFATAFLFSCTDTKKEKPEEVQTAVNLMESPAPDSCAEPYLFTDKNGIVYLSWIEKRGKEAALSFSVIENGKWAEAFKIANGNNWFVNWADYPVIATDGKNNFLAHILEKSDTAKFTYDVRMIAWSDSGKVKGSSFLLNDDGKKAEHGFVSIVPYNDGFFACWLDGRKTASEESHGGHDGHHGEMTIRAATLTKDGIKTNEWELDGRVCDCCQTSAAITDNGPVVIYRDRSDDEVRDNYITRYVNGQWTTPKAIYDDSWKINACPVNGPRISAIGNNLATVFYSMKDKKGEVKLSFSNNGGESFGQPIRIDEGNTIGRAGVILLDSTTAFVSWMEAGNIKAAKVHADGTKEKSMMIATSSDKRSSGFPQMTRSGNKIYFAWTDSEKKTIRTANLEI